MILPSRGPRLTFDCDEFALWRVLGDLIVEAPCMGHGNQCVVPPVHKEDRDLDTRCLRGELHAGVPEIGAQGGREEPRSLP